MIDELTLLLAVGAMLLVGITLIVCTYLPRVRHKSRRATRRFFRLAGFIITVLCLMMLFG